MGGNLDSCQQQMLTFQCRKTFWASFGVERAGPSLCSSRWFRH